MQDLVKAGLIKVLKVGTLNNPADLLTKYVSVETLSSLKGRLGVHPVLTVCVPPCVRPRTDAHDDAPRLMHCLGLVAGLFWFAGRPVPKALRIYNTAA